MRNKILTLLLLLGLAWPADAWDRVGHMVVGAIAWEQMTDQARTRSVELLHEAPNDSELAVPGFPPRELFMRAGYWPDIVRDETWPARKEKYDHSTWHYVNHFWNDEKPLPEMGTVGELLDRLDAIARDELGPLELAWFLHLMGDVHQPLHSSARVSERDPNGDRGGNGFLLADPEAGNLHSVWDGILRRTKGKTHSESYVGWLSRLASEITEKHPRATLEDELGVEGFVAWSKAAAEIARTRGYPDDLPRDGIPSKRYEAEVLEISERQIALAGHRIAAILNERFE